MYIYKTHGTCSSAIKVELEGDKVKEVEFIGGCHGNTQGLASLVKGMSVNEVVKKLQGIDCRGRGTSCPDQLSKALIEAYENG